MRERLQSGAKGFLATLAIVAIASLTVFAFSESATQDDTATSAGVFTEEQAARGKEAYTQECAACHLDDLLGDGIAPPLLGVPFTYRWTDLSLGDLYSSLYTTMPQGAPASLSPDVYVDIIAYLLQVNEYPTGDTELPTEEEALQLITVDAQQQ